MPHVSAIQPLLRIDEYPDLMADGCVSDVCLPVALVPPQSTIGSNRLFKGERSISSSQRSFTMNLRYLPRLRSAQPSSAPRSAVPPVVLEYGGMGLSLSSDATIGVGGYH